MIRFPDVLTEDQLQRIYEAALTLLTDVGFLVKSDDLLEYYRQAGCTVGPRLDKPKGSHQVFFSQEIIEKAVDLAPSQFTLYPTAPAYRTLDMGAGHTWFSNVGGDYIRDWRTGELRPATIRDMVESCRLIDALDHVDFNGMPIYWMYDLVDQERYDRYGLFGAYMAIEALHSGKGKSTVYFSGTSTELPDVIRAGQICAGGADAYREHPNQMIIVCPISPLYISGKMSPEEPWGHADQLITAASAGSIILIGPCGLLGVSGPVAVAGMLAQSTAEFLALNVAVQTVNPSNPVFFHDYCATADMSTGSKHEAWPEAALIHVGMAAMAKFLKLPSYPLNDSSSPEADAQLGWEHMATFLTQMLAGADVVQGMGGLTVDDVFDPKALVIDNEIVSYAKRIARGIAVDDTTLPLNVMKEVGTAPLAGDYLAAEHTMEHHGAELWQPSKVVNGMARDAWVHAGSRSINDRAGDVIDEILATHEPSVPEQTQKELRGLIAEILDREGVTGDEAKTIMEKTCWQGVS